MARSSEQERSAARTYRQTGDEDEITTVEVGISSMMPGEVEACVMWPDRLLRGDVVPANMTASMPVLDALEYAEIVRARYGFPEVVILVQHEDLWREEWGQLLGIDESELLA